jgi:hypothetical protein
VDLGDIDHLRITFSRLRPRVQAAVVEQRLLGDNC